MIKTALIITASTLAWSALIDNVEAIGKAASKLTIKDQPTVSKALQLLPAALLSAWVIKRF